MITHMLTRFSSNPNFSDLRRVAPGCQHGLSRSHISRQLRRIETKGEGKGRTGEEVVVEKGQEDGGRVKRKRCSYEHVAGSGGCVLRDPVRWW